MTDFLPMPPPVLYGPIYPITPTVHLSGVGIGYALIAKGTTSGLLANHFYKAPGDRPIADQWIPFDTLPKAGEFITVEQTYTFPAGGPYESGETPVNKRIKVQPLPNPVPLVAITPIHTCSDYIHLAGLIPGAWVNVQVEGGPMLVSKQAKKGTDDSFHLNPDEELPGGKRIVVWQTVGKPGERDKESPPSYSTIEKATFKNPLDPLGFYETPKTCFNEVAISNILNEADLQVQAPDNDQKFGAWTFELERYKYQGYFRDVIGPGAPEVANAYQLFKRCNLQSPVKNSPQIIKTTKLPVPDLKAPICKESTSITVTGLGAGNRLKIERFVDGQPSPVRDNIMWKPIGDSEVEVDVSPRWPFDDPAGGSVSLTFQQLGGEGCDLDSDTSAFKEVKLSPITDAPQPVLFPKKMYHCTDVLLADQLTPGASLQILDNDDQTILPRPLAITDSSMFVRLPTRLPTKKSIRIEQQGCGADKNSDPIEVTAYESARLRSPGIDSHFPPYGGDKSIRAVNLVPGAKAYVLVDGSRYTSNGRLWTPQIDVFSETLTIDLVAPLNTDMTVTVLQYLCDESDLSEPKVYTVVKPKISLYVKVNNGHIVRGTSGSIRVDCGDSRLNVIQNNPGWGAITVGTFGTIRCGGSVTALIATSDSTRSIPITLAATDINQGSSTGVAVVAPNYRITLTANPRDQRVIHPTEGAVRAKMDFYHIEVTVEYPATPNNLNLGAASFQNSVSGILQNPEPTVHGTLQITGSAVFYPYGSDGNPLPENGAIAQLTLEAQRGWDETGNLCAEFNVAFQYGSTADDIIWTGGDSIGLIHGTVRNC